MKAAAWQINHKNYIQRTQKYLEALLIGINYDEKKYYKCLIDKIRAVKKINTLRRILRRLRTQKRD